MPTRRLIATGSRVIGFTRKLDQPVAEYSRVLAKCRLRGAQGHHCANGPNEPFRNKSWIT
jgi:hypothetical protein